MGKKAVVILSGGPDSTILLYYVKSKGFDVSAISFKYGQIAEKEVEIAKGISENIGIPIKIVDLSSLNEIYKNVTGLCSKEIAIPETFEKSIIVPFRNAVFLSVAVSYADVIGAEQVFYGAQGSDAPFYPDCRRRFFKAFQKAAREGTGSHINIDAPFHKMRKPDIIKLASKLGVPIEKTWSCYLDGEKHCGNCESCINRKNAFMEAGLKDLTEYKT